MNSIGATIISHPFFQTMPPEHLALLSKNAQEVEFQSGEILFREGEPANRFYLIESGRVAIEAGAQEGKSIQTLGPGEVLGWSWLFPPFAWHFQARATEPTTAIIFSGAHLLTTAESNHDFGYELMKRMAQVVIHRLQATRRQLLALQVESALEG